MPSAILFFVKHPTPGRVKTRLAARVGAEQAAAIYKQLAEKVCELLPRGVQIYVAYDPPEKRSEIEAWIGSLLAAGALSPQAPAPKFFAQGGGNLGERISHAFNEVFATGCEKVALVGSDCIEIDAPMFETAWRALDGHECVIGPAIDGGYYLMALRHPCPTLFENITWSSDSTLLETLQRARESGLNVFLLPLKSDVDTERDWLRARERLAS